MAQQCVQIKLADAATYKALEIMLTLMQPQTVNVTVDMLII